MKRLARLHFTSDDRQQLTKAMQNAESSRLFRRLQAVRLMADGLQVNSVVQITGLSRSTIYNLAHRYRQTHNTVSLHDQARTGRPKTASAITPARLLAELKRSPLRLGYRANVWTVKLLALRLAERYHCTISPRTLRRRMRELGLRCKRPRYVYSEREPHLAQKKGLSHAS